MFDGSHVSLFLHETKQKKPRVQTADIISAVEYDAESSDLAKVDRGACVMLFERTEASSCSHDLEQQQAEGTTRCGEAAAGTPIDGDG